MANIWYLAATEISLIGCKTTSTQVRKLQVLQEIYKKNLEELFQNSNKGLETFLWEAYKKA